jgi:uncharacterized protein YjlB
VQAEVGQGGTEKGEAAGCEEGDAVAVDARPGCGHERGQHGDTDFSADLNGGGDQPGGQALLVLGLDRAEKTVPALLDNTFKNLTSAEREQLSALLGKLLHVHP